MVYLVINLTSYGTGYYPLGTFKSKKRAEALMNKMVDDDYDIEVGNSWTVIPIESLDKYTDESLVKWAKAPQD
jgi:hypothetical protein